MSDRSEKSEKSSGIKTDPVKEGSRESTGPESNSMSASAESESKPVAASSIVVPLLTGEGKSEQNSKEVEPATALKPTKISASISEEATSPSKRGFKKSAKRRKAPTKERNKDGIRPESQPADPVTGVNTARPETPKTHPSSSGRSLGSSIPSLCTTRPSTLKVESESLKTPPPGLSTACSSASRIPTQAMKEPPKRLVCRECEKWVPSIYLK